MAATMIQRLVSLEADWLGNGTGRGGCAAVCSHSCPLGRGEYFHALVWGDHCFLHLFILTTAWAKGGGKECFCLGAFIGGLGMPNEQNTKFPGLVQLTF